MAKTTLADFPLFKNLAYVIVAPNVKASEQKNFTLNCSANLHQKNVPSATGKAQRPSASRITSLFSRTT
jgi:hypothetical protein